MRRIDDVAEEPPSLADRTEPLDHHGLRARPDGRRFHAAAGARHEPYRLADGALDQQVRRRCSAALGQPAPALPAGFEEGYTKETAASDDPAKFATKEVYLDLAAKTKAASLAALDAIPESKLDDPGPEPMREYAPTVAAVLTMLGAHWLMHCRAVRRRPPQAGQAAAVLILRGRILAIPPVVETDTNPKRQRGF